MQFNLETKSTVFSILSLHLFYYNTLLLYCNRNCNFNLINKKKKTSPLKNKKALGMLYMDVFTMCTTSFVIPFGF